jgi:Domain of unknown function (DUF4156)
MARRTVLTAGVISAVIAVCACKSLTPEGSKVRVTSNPEVVRGCTFLGNVRDEAMHAVGTPKRAEDMLRSKTAALGGNVLMVTTSTSTYALTAMSGEAYLCVAQPSNTDRQPVEVRPVNPLIDPPYRAPSEVPPPPSPTPKPPDE